jgi:hypothetical protein
MNILDLFVLAYTFFACDGLRSVDFAIKGTIDYFDDSFRRDMV